MVCELTSNNNKEFLKNHFLLTFKLTNKPQFITIENLNLWHYIFYLIYFFTALASLSYEKVCVLFNIAALQSGIAALQSVENDDGLKLAAKLLQVGVFVLFYYISKTIKIDSPVGFGVLYLFFLFNVNNERFFFSKHLEFLVI